MATHFSGITVDMLNKAYVASMLRLDLTLLSPRRMCYEKFGA